jgi:AcrR family transcriptional regulator
VGVRERDHGEFSPGQLPEHPAPIPPASSIDQHILDEIDVDDWSRPLIEPSDPVCHLLHDDNLREEEELKAYASVSILYRTHAVAYDEHSMSASRTTVAKRRLSRDDWIAAALDAIADGGLSAVAVEPLAAGLGVTKGSFYAHFATRDELIEATLESWERSHAGSGLAQFADIADPVERLRAVLLAGVTFSQSGAPSVHMSLLGELGDPRVRGAVSRVTDQRVELLTQTYRRLGLPPKRAADRARMAYAAYLGLLQMAREAPDRTLSRREIARFMNELTAAMIPSA